MSVNFYGLFVSEESNKVNFCLMQEKICRKMHKNMKKMEEKRDDQETLIF